MQSSVASTQPIAIDVFSGAGALTWGLKRAGFRVAAAVEIEGNAFATYKTNHPEVHAIKQDVRTVRGADLRKIVGAKIDLLAGCPPCQGFSTLTNTSSKRDPRNNLVLEMARLVRELRPRAVMMENVPGLADRGKRLFNRFLRTLEELDYRFSWEVLQVANYGVPQNRRRLVLVAGHRKQLILPEPTYHRTGKGGLPQWKTLRDVLPGLGRAMLFEKARKAGGAHRFNWHVTRRLSPENVARLRAARPGASRTELPKSLRPDCHKELNSGYTSVYGRMAWSQLPVTITGGCTTLSKGRFGHPSALRTISVREAARIQTFPDDYIFDTPYMEYACEMIGNALPCSFAEALAVSVNSQLQAKRKR